MDNYPDAQFLHTMRDTLPDGKRVIAIIGPTASGKSALAVRLARRFNGEVIGADSRQVYRGLDVGTGKITKKEMYGIPHHLLDVADPRKQFSVAVYQKISREKIAEILGRDKVEVEKQLWENS